MRENEIEIREKGRDLGGKVLRKLDGSTSLMQAFKSWRKDSLSMLTPLNRLITLSTLAFDSLAALERSARPRNPS